MERAKRSRKVSGIYQITSNLNHKFYIGSAVHITRRIREHFLRLKKGVHVNRILQNHVNKYGLIDLDIIILEYCDESKLIEREQYWIDKLSPRFNICQIAGSNLGVKFTEESLRKMREINTGEGNPMFGVHKYGEEAPAFGLVHTDEAKEKQREATRKRWEDLEYRKEREAYTHSEDALKKMSESHLGKKQSEEEIANKKIRTKNAWQDPKYRESHVNGMKGKKQSDEHVKKNSEAQKEWWSNPENRKRQCESRKLSWEKRKKDKAV